MSRITQRYVRCQMASVFVRWLVVTITVCGAIPHAVEMRAAVCVISCATSGMSCS